MKKILTHWTFAFVTLFVVTYIGLKDPQIKEVLRLKGFDLLLTIRTKRNFTRYTRCQHRRESHREVWTMALEKRCTC
jgi:hypothetical protein